MPDIHVIGKRRGRPPLFGEPARRRVKVQFTDEQREDLTNIALAERRPVAAVIRDAVNEYVGDFREKRVFQLPAPKN